MAYLRTQLGALALSKQGSVYARRYKPETRVLRRGLMNQAPLLPSSSQTVVAESAPVAELPRTTSGLPSSSLSTARVNSSTILSQSSPTSGSQSSVVLTPNFASTSSAPQQSSIVQEATLDLSSTQAQRPASASHPILITSDTPILEPLPTNIVSSAAGFTTATTKGSPLESLAAHLRAASSTRTDGSTSTSSPAAGGVISRNPPIVAGIILLGVVFIAAFGSLVSWILRARRRQRNHRLAALGLENESLEHGFDNLQESEESREKLCGGSDTLKYPGRPPPRASSPKLGQGEPFMVEDLGYRSAREQDGPYSPTFRMTGRTTVSPFDPYPSRTAFTAPRQRENFGLPRDNRPRFLSLEGPGLGHPWTQPGHDPFTEEPFPVPPAPYMQSPESFPPSRRSSKNPIQSTWATSIRSTLSSALGAARQAAGHRASEATTPSISAGPSRRSTMPMQDDVFTPMALRPARMSMSKGLQRRGTAEGRELAFVSPTHSKASKSIRRSGAFTSTSVAISRRPSTLTRTPSRLERSTSRRMSIPHERPTAYSSGLQARPSTLSSRSRSRSRSISGSSMSEKGGEARWRE